MVDHGDGRRSASPLPDPCVMAGNSPVTVTATFTRAARAPTAGVSPIALAVTVAYTQPAVEIPERDFIKPSKASLSPCKSPLERGRTSKTVGEAAFVVDGLRTLGSLTLCARTVRMCTLTGKRMATPSAPPTETILVVDDEAQVLELVAEASCGRRATPS